MIKSLIHDSVVACIILSLPHVFQACSNDPYDTGDGSLSYMCADFVEATTDGSANVVSATTDDGKALTLSPSIKADWITATDSTYRALLYYNHAGGNDMAATVKPLAIGSVLVPNILHEETSANPYPTDPVTLETAWMSRSQKYINLGISVKTGKIDNKIEPQSFGIALAATTTTADGHRCFRLKLIHDQGNAPEYYSTQVYVSIPLYRFPVEVSGGDRFEISVNTYKGTVTRTFYSRQQ